MITLEKARLEDCRTIFQWRNHPAVRKHFFDSRELSYSEHKEWFENSLERKDRIILIAYKDVKKVGVIRFDFLSDSNTAEIDIYVAPEMHGNGFGKKILAKGEDWVRENTSIKTLVAKVKPGNEISMKMFKGRGFGAKHVLLKKDVRES